MLRFSATTSSTEFTFDETMLPDELISATTTNSATMDMADFDLFQGLGEWEDIMNPGLYAETAAAMVQTSGSNSADGFEASQDGTTDQWTQLMGRGGS